jgi:DNA-binding transcriptional MerR regulator
MPDTQKLVSSSVAARELGVHYSALSRWAAEGRITPASRTAGGHFRWDLAELRRQLHADAQDVALDPVRTAYAAAIAVIAAIDDLHTALAIVAKLITMLQSQLAGAATKRDELVHRIYEEDSLVLKPLADQVAISQARAQREGR